MLCVIDIFSKCAWVILLKDKKGITITSTFQKFLNESKRKPNKIWVDKGSEFYNRLMKSWLMTESEGNNEGNSVVAERFIRTLKNKIYKYISSISKFVYIDKLDDIVKPRTHINSSKEINNKDPQFKIGDIVRISNYKTFLQKVIFQTGLKKFL